MCLQKIDYLLLLILLSVSGCQKEKKTAVRVSSIAFWTDAALDLHIGQSVVIQATGEVYGRYPPPERSTRVRKTILQKRCNATNDTGCYEDNKGDFTSKINFH